MIKYRFDRSQFQTFVAAVVDPSAGCYELKILNAYQKDIKNFIEPATRPGCPVLGGWYDDPSRLSFTALSVRRCNTYVTFNPVDKALMRRAANRVKPQRKGSPDDSAGTTDADVRFIRYLLVDVDAGQASGCSATDEQHAAALGLRDKILSVEPGIRDCALFGSSGNGGWILIRVGDLDNSPQNIAMCKDVLVRLADIYGRVSRGHCGIDTQTFNPSRLVALPGTLKCKGEDLPDAPWRPVTIDGGF